MVALCKFINDIICFTYNYINVLITQPYVIYKYRQDFTEFANFTFHEYGHKVKHWITFNEPWVFSRAGYDVGKKAPGRCSPYIPDYGHHCEDGRSGYEAYQVSHNLLLSHGYAVDAFRKCKKVTNPNYIL